VVPIGISRSGPLGAVLVLHDVSALKEALRALEVARDRAEASDRSKSLFLATMSHELRTPLNAIIGYSELLSELSDDPETSVDLRRIRQAGRHLLELIDDILDLSKVESGRIELRVERFPAREVVNQVAPLAAMMCEANGNRWELRGDDRLVLRSDRSRTRQVLLNLVSNAAKFTQQGTVTMTVTADAGWVRFDVTDTGIGMSDDQVSRLFGLFTQVHTGNRERYGGTGLGLALSRRLCLAMGGDLAVSSELGRGSTFVVRLPAG
jgi:hypothetical protein